MRSYDVERYAGMRQCENTPLLNRTIVEARRRREFRWSTVQVSEATRGVEIMKSDDSRSSRGSGTDRSKSHMQIALDLMRR